MARIAGHFPTKQIDHAEWLAAPVFGEGDIFPPYGLNRACDDFGKPVVFYNPEFDSGEIHWVARPIVRVKMGRA